MQEYERRNIMKEHELVKKAKKRFDAELHTPEYKKIHSNDKHLESLLNMCTIEKNGHYLDLGTGNGYLAFALAERFPEAFFTGLDIAVKSIKTNNQIVRSGNKKNISFQHYAGMHLPFESDSFDGIISRYALHHFPDIHLSLREINRVLKTGGFFILSDPVTLPSDTRGFIDQFQNLKNDGHIHFYYEDELYSLFEEYSFRRENVFYSKIRYPRPLDSRYKELIHNSPLGVINKYHVELMNEEVFIEVKVINAMFRKTANCPVRVTGND
jgi:ubiquinone/menaquinone biosynthesis C-methylase UbiE